MAYDIKQSSTESALLFLLVLSSDHISPATGLSPTVTLSKNGAAFAAASGAVTELANGWYKVAANATDTAVLGPLLLHASVATADNCDIVVANIVAYDPQATDLGLTPTSESYVAAGSVGTFSTILQALRAFPSSKWVPGSGSGVLTTYKVNGSTAAKTYTGNDPVNPTQLIETT